MGEVGSNEDSGQADADLNCPEPCPKHHPQHPARGRWPHQCQGQLLLPGVLRSHPEQCLAAHGARPGAHPAWGAMARLSAHSLVPQWAQLQACLLWSTLCPAQVILANSLPVFERPQLLLPHGSGEEGCHHDIVHTCCAHGMAGGAPWARRETQVRLPFRAGCALVPGGLPGSSPGSRGCGTGWHCTQHLSPEAVVPPLWQAPSSVPRCRQGWSRRQHRRGSVGAWLWLRSPSARQDWAEGTDHSRWLVLSAPGTPEALPWLW